MTGADKLYVLLRDLRVLIVPANTYYNPLSEKHPIQPPTLDFVLSMKAMDEEFKPRLTEYLQRERMTPVEVQSVMNLLFEKVKYQGHTWHKKEISKTASTQDMCISWGPRTGIRFMDPISVTGS